MYIPSSHLLPVHQKRQTDPEPNSDNLIPHVDNKLALILGVSLAIAAILALLLNALLRRYCLRRSKSSAQSNAQSAPESESSPRETPTAPRRSSVSHSRPSNVGSDNTESTFCTDSPVALKKHLYDHVLPYPPPPAVLSVATTTSQSTPHPERSRSWDSIARRLDEKADTSHARRMSTPPTLSPPSPRTPNESV
jgi:hypothetical protein